MVKIISDGIDSILPEENKDAKMIAIKSGPKTGHAMRDDFFFYHDKDQKNYHEKLELLEIYLLFKDNKMATGVEISGMNMIINKFDRNMSESMPINIFYFEFLEDYFRRVENYKQKKGVLPFETKDDLRNYVSYLNKILKPGKYFMANVMRGIYYRNKAGKEKKISGAK
ncbi:MAG: hypothetical protein ACP5N3_03570 [Candidatus Nanoarchaeia archaeon]